MRLAQGIWCETPLEWRQRMDDNYRNRHVTLFGAWLATVAGMKIQGKGDPNLPILWRGWVWQMPAFKMRNRKRLSALRERRKSFLRKFRL